MEDPANNHLFPANFYRGVGPAVIEGCGQFMLAFRGASLSIISLVKRLLIVVFFHTTGVQAGEVSGKVNLSGAARSSRKSSGRYAGQTGGNAAKAPAPRAIVYLEGSFSVGNLASARKNGVIGQKDF